MSSNPVGASQPIGLPPIPLTVPGISINKNPGPEMDCPKNEWEPEYRETFSKSILRQRFQEFKGGKYTKRYIETYLEFMVLSGMISNLDYLEFKRTLVEE